MKFLLASLLLVSALSQEHRLLSVDKHKGKNYNPPKDAKGPRPCDTSCDDNCDATCQQKAYNAIATSSHKSCEHVNPIIQYKRFLECQAGQTTPCAKQCTGTSDTSTCVDSNDNVNTFQCIAKPSDAPSGSADYVCTNVKEEPSEPSSTEEWPDDYDFEDSVYPDFYSEAVLDCQKDIYGKTNDNDVKNFFNCTIECFTDFWEDENIKGNNKGQQLLMGSLILLLTLISIL